MGKIYSLLNLGLTYDSFQSFLQGIRREGFTTFTFRKDLNILHLYHVFSHQLDLNGMYGRPINLFAFPSLFSRY